MDEVDGEEGTLSSLDKFQLPSNCFRISLSFLKPNNMTLLLFGFSRSLGAVTSIPNHCFIQKGDVSMKWKLPQLFSLRLDVPVHFLLTFPRLKKKSALIVLIILTLYISICIHLDFKSQCKITYNSGECWQIFIRHHVFLCICRSIGFLFTSFS